MSENSTATTDLTSQYTAQVANDLERNVKEQERVGAEIAALQEQLTVLQHDHTLLVNMRQALGLAAAPGEPAAPAEPKAAAEPAAPAEPVGTPGAGTAPDRATVPAPRRRGGAKSGADKPKRAKKAGARTASGKSARKPSTEAERPEAQSARTDGPKLVELVRLHLGEQSEPRSAAEVAAALGQAHPERTIRTTVVRGTLEGLVARNQAQRSKQGSSVFYTAPDGTEGSAAGDEEAQS
ncbi:hypothetical protein GCM10010294_35090 [Streptomyces griseoloalbus]|uniref:hypothetical protein n=1 Tax=Streptomyces griseoloalbus TaxID=67303 RepID=UPI001877301E|nr:hypothetical protein GCM10010294_35090 [Streptomyces griseoloalbus]